MDASWDKDKVGQPAMYMNVRASCKDHAKFGYLMLRKGCWKGKRILSESWVKNATSPSQSFNKGYGYWWWLNGHKPTLDSVSFKAKDDMLHPFAPHDSFCAVGLGNQVIEVIPSLDLVIVRLGIAPQDDLSLWLLQRDQILKKMKEDGKQLVHNGVVLRVLRALIKK